MGTCGQSLGTRWFCESLCCLLIRGMKKETDPRSPHITSRRREPTGAQACASPVLLRRAAEKWNFTLCDSKWGCWNLGVTIQRIEIDCNSSKYHAKRGTKEPCLTWQRWEPRQELEIVPAVAEVTPPVPSQAVGIGRLTGKGERLSLDLLKG